MGPVKERYIHYEKTGDQFVGRVVSGLDVNDPKFGVSPCYFDFSQIKCIHEKQKMKEEIELNICELLIGNYDDIPPYIFLYAVISMHLYAFTTSS